MSLVAEMADPRPTVEGAAAPDYGRAQDETAKRQTEGEGTMRIARATVVLGAVIVATLSLGLSPAAAPPACTWTGTPGPDVKHGTPGNDVLCGLGGDDQLYGGPRERPDPRRPR